MHKLKFGEIYHKNDGKMKTAAWEPCHAQVLYMQSSNYVPIEIRAHKASVFFMQQKLFSNTVDNLIVESSRKPQIYIHH